MKEIKHKTFKNGAVYLLKTDDGYLIETTDTFLPFYTKDAIGRKTNVLEDTEVGDRSERFMVGLSVMSGCPIRCKFCATGNMERWRNLTADEIVEQVDFILKKNPLYGPGKSKEFKINYTRMGSPFLNIENVKKRLNILIHFGQEKFTIIYQRLEFKVLIFRGLKIMSHYNYRYIV